MNNNLDVEKEPPIRKEVNVLKNNLITVYKLISLLNAKLESFVGDSKKRATRLVVDTSKDILPEISVARAIAERWNAFCEQKQYSVYSQAPPHLTLEDKYHLRTLRRLCYEWDPDTIMDKLSEEEEGKIFLAIQSLVSIRIMLHANLPMVEHNEDPAKNFTDEEIEAGVERFEAKLTQQQVAVARAHLTHNPGFGPDDDPMFYTDDDPDYNEVDAYLSHTIDIE